MSRNYRGLPNRQWHSSLNTTGHRSNFTRRPHHRRNRSTEASFEACFADLSLNDEADDELPHCRPTRDWRRQPPQNSKVKSRRYGHDRQRSHEIHDGPSLASHTSPTSRKGNSHIGQEARYSNIQIQPLDFGKAMTQLFRQLEKAEKFYHNFQSGYDSDIKNIKRYARLSILTSLWTARVFGNKAVGNESTSFFAGDSEGSYAEEFTSMYWKVRHTLNAALHSTFNEQKQRLSMENLHRQSSRRDAAKRLLEKVSIATQQIVGLLESASSTREDCQALLEELRLLKKLVDPAVLANKKIYCCVDDDKDIESGKLDGGGLGSHDEPKK